MYDVIVVGARCAGAPLAMLLARRGSRVLVVDRAAFPSEPLCMNQVPASGVVLLRRWGVLQGGPCPQRLELDAAMLDAARRAGAEVRETFTVRDLAWSRGRVAGIVGHAADGHTVCELATVVVGADGRRSIVAEAAGAATLLEFPPTRCCYLAYWTGVEATRPQWFSADGGVVGVLPAGADAVCVVVALPVTAWARFKRFPEKLYREHTEGCAPLATGRRQSRLFGTADLGTVTRALRGPGWALAGDASRHTDPFESGGIARAYRDAELLAGALDRGLSGPGLMDRALARYEQLLAVRDEGAGLDSGAQMVAQSGIGFRQAIQCVLDGPGNALAGPLGV